MSEKDQIREMVYALARGDHDAAQQASKAVFAAKSKRIAEAAMTQDEPEKEDTEVSDEAGEEVKEGMHSPARRHVRAGARHMRRKQLHRDMARRSDTTEARRDDLDDDEELVVRRKRRPSPSMRRRRPRRSDMYEKKDTPVDSSDVVTEKTDDVKDEA